MKKLKWVIVIAAVLLVVFVGVVVVGLYLGLDALAKQGIESIGTRMCQAPVTVEDVDLSPFSGEGELDGLVVGNPEGYHTESALELKSIQVSIEPSSVRSDTLVIREVAVDSLLMTWEGGLRESNLTQLKENIEAYMPASDEAAEDEGAARKVIIDRFAFRNGQVRLSLKAALGKSVTVSLPELELTDIGRKSGGITVAEAAEQIFTQLYTAVVEAMAQSDVITDVVGGTGEAAKQLLGVGSEAAGGILEKGGDAAGTLLDGMKNLAPGASKDPEAEE